ncbi:hypothetical protein [Brevibacillus choshinensis]|uniref:Uncharacterized protein n=1 Tax=Brevibacillus choshinensis TaxID=54911 RepID=A0ABX7FIJ8_BRECH|nr:hypothetical protein [Brevibacillus choshinensis]QRG65092.1 hypothetical protein JNE38_15660 [Brevibacillus choshinensis]
MLYRLCFILFALGFVVVPASAATDIGRIRIDPTPVNTWQDLVKQSELIVVSWVDSANQSVSTRRTLREGALVNYVQSLHVKQALKGSGQRLLKLVSTGVEPLPDASSPLNRTYPGPLAEGNYILFLRHVSGTDLYSTVGLWQGVYPLSQGQTIALQGSGFSELNQLTVEEFARKLRSVSSR